MSNDKLASTIDDAFEARDKVGPKTKGAVRKAVNAALELLDAGKARVAERKADGHWQVNQWLKKAVLLSFRLNDMSVIPGGPGKAAWWDKVDSKFKGWSAARFRKAGFRAVPGCVVRRSALGDGRKLRADRQELSHLRRRRHRRRTGAAAGRPSYHRGQLLRRRKVRSGRGCHRAHWRGPIDGRLSRRLDPHCRPQDRANHAR
jgi:hypothetical protein